MPNLAGHVFYIQRNSKFSQSSSASCGDAMHFFFDVVSGKLGKKKTRVLLTRSRADDFPITRSDAQPLSCTSLAGLLRSQCREKGVLIRNAEFDCCPFFVFTSKVYTQIMDRNDVKWRRMEQSDNFIAERNGLIYQKFSL